MHKQISQLLKSISVFLLFTIDIKTMQLKTEHKKRKKNEPRKGLCNVALKPWVIVY